MSEAEENRGDQSAAPGGLGGGTTRDTRLLERALSERWPIPPEKRRAVVERLLAVVLNDGAKDRERISAAKALIAADAQNLEQEKRDAGGETFNVRHSGPDGGPMQHAHTLTAYAIAEARKLLAMAGGDLPANG